jgi:hypothetical protein
MDRAGIELLVRDAGGTATGDDFVTWAEQALVAGRDSPALRALAGLAGRPRSDARPLFDRAIRELGLPLPATEEALRRAYLVVLAGDISSGARRPSDALDLIHHEVISPLKHPADLMAWCFAWESLDPERGFASLNDAERDDAARALARKTLREASQA